MPMLKASEMSCARHVGHTAGVGTVVPKTDINPRHDTWDCHDGLPSGTARAGVVDLRRGLFGAAVLVQSKLKKIRRISRTGRALEGREREGERRGRSYQLGPDRTGCPME